MSAARVAILIPIFNDWDSLAKLLPEIDASLGSAGLRGHVTVVDDGSTAPRAGAMPPQDYRQLDAVDVVRLRCNLGHQRALAVGMAHLHKNGAGADSLVIMDGDGQDRPEYIPALLAELSRTQARVVFASRTKRFESLTFRLMYNVYRLIHWLLTGISVRVGNFSALSTTALPGLLVSPDLWNHYAAAVFRSRIHIATLPLLRGKRYLGETRMGYGALVAHGLSAIAVFGEIVGARLIVLFSAAVALAFILMAIVVLVRVFTDYAIPGWATNAFGLLVLFAMQAILSLLILTLIVLGSRSQARFIPLRDAEFYIESVGPLAPHE
jgi:glycosyltransferase involved in cell wall biosynthesis